MNKILFYFISISFLLSENDFNEGPYGAQYFDIAGPFTVIDLNLELGDYIDKLSNEKLWADELPNLENKFDLIILGDLLEQTKEPKLLLENLSNFLSDTGSMVATVKNFLYLKNIFRIFEGITPQSNPNSYDLGTLSLFLNNENFIISELDRFKFWL